MDKDSLPRLWSYSRASGFGALTGYGAVKAYEFSYGAPGTPMLLLIFDIFTAVCVGVFVCCTWTALRLRFQPVDRLVRWARAQMVAAAARLSRRRQEQADVVFAADMQRLSDERKEMQTRR
ncbi:hypothetical protein [Actinoplanes sp. URMC 104]|uniref:hypothetical protein n=1 Tax=Actinoplanes sp. URMC 104 TaxID=3423409 RepID=UPI003F1E13C3